MLDLQWQEAIAKEIDVLEQNHTWTLENFPPSKKPIPSKWVYGIKYNSDGTVERFKTHLVIKEITKLWELIISRLLLLLLQ